MHWQLKLTLVHGNSFPLVLAKVWHVQPWLLSLQECHQFAVEGSEARCLLGGNQYHRPSIVPNYKHINKQTSFEAAAAFLFALCKQ